MNTERIAMDVKLLLILTVALFAFTALAQDRNPNTDATITDSALAGYVTVQLQGLPIASYDGSEPVYAATRPQPGQRLNLNSTAAQAYAQHLGSKRQAFKNWLAQNLPNAKVVRDFAIVENAITINLNGYMAD